MTAIRIDQETETPRGWQFRAEMSTPDGAVSQHTLRISWADYDHWSHGAEPPARVAAAVMRFLADRGERPPAEFDAAIVRRRHRDFDEVIGRYF